MEYAQYMHKARPKGERDAYERQGYQTAVLSLLNWAMMVATAAHKAAGWDIMHRSRFATPLEIEGCG